MHGAGWRCQAAACPKGGGGRGQSWCWHRDSGGALGLAPKVLAVGVHCCRLELLAALVGAPKVLAVGIRCCRFGLLAAPVADQSREKFEATAVNSNCQYLGWQPVQGTLNSVAEWPAPPGFGVQHSRLLSEMLQEGKVCLNKPDSVRAADELASNAGTPQLAEALLAEVRRSAYASVPQDQVDAHAADACEGMAASARDIVMRLLAARADAPMRAMRCCSRLSSR